MDMCKDREMMVFEPRDATANGLVYDAFAKNIAGNYWINVKREDASKQ